MSDLTPAAAHALRFLLGQEARPFPTEDPMNAQPIAKRLAQVARRTT